MPKRVGVDSSVRSDRVGMQVVLGAVTAVAAIYAAMDSSGMPQIHSLSWRKQLTTKELHSVARRETVYGTIAKTTTLQGRKGALGNPPRESSCAARGSV